MSKNSKTLTEKEIRRLMNSVGGKNSAMSKKGGGFSMGGYSKGGSHNDNYRKDSSSRDRSNSSSRNSSGGVRSVKGASMLSSLPKKNSAYKIEGTFSYSGRGFGFVVPDEEYASTNGDVFISPKDTAGAMTGDHVTVSVTGIGEKGSPEGIVTSVEASVKSIIGTLHVVPKNGRFDGYAYVIPDNKRAGVNVYIPDEDVKEANAHDMEKVEVIPSGEDAFTRTRSITVRGPADMPYFDTKGKISKVFGSALTREANYSAVLYQSGIRTVFPAEVLENAEKVASAPLELGNRRDLRQKLIMTIDGASAKDLDDAVSLEKIDGGWILGVHIADVSNYVRQNTPVEEEARLRGTSVYFTDKVVPMLPEVLSNGVCSLNAHEDKYALTAEITLDENGNRKSTRIFKSMIRSTVRGVYDEVNDIFENPDSEYREKYAPVLGMLSDMHEMYFKLAKLQEQRGVMELEDCEPIIIVDENSMPIDIIKRERGDAEKMIEQFMLQANMGVAEVLKSLGLPCLYRIHEKPSEEKIENFVTFAHNVGLNTAHAVKAEDAHELSTALMEILDEAREKGIEDSVSEMMLRSMMKAKYQAVCLPHFGLGADTYCHFTSPIRRYPDTFVHTVITTVFENTNLTELTFSTVMENIPHAVTELANVAEARGNSSTECEIVALTAERDIEDLYMTLYMQPKLGETFDVVVSSVIRSGMFVQCDNLVEGFIPALTLPGSKTNPEMMILYYAGKKYELGTPLKAKLVDTDVPTRKITFELVTE